jgi:formiminoglutamase
MKLMILIMLRKVRVKISSNYIEQNIIHLGGGHDHVYPLLKAIETKYKKIIILNIDPHCDTRESEHNHSGTPFRQFLK